MNITRTLSIQFESSGVNLCTRAIEIRVYTTGARLDYFGVRQSRRNGNSQANGQSKSIWLIHGV